MTLEQRGLHRMIHARLDKGIGSAATGTDSTNGNGNGNGNGSGSSAAAASVATVAADSNTPSTSSAAAPTSTTQQATPTPSSSSTPAAVVKSTATTTDAAPTTTSPASSPSTSSSSSSTSSSSSSRVVTNTRLTTTPVPVATFNGANTGTSTFYTLSQTGNNVGSTVTAGPTSTGSSAISAGPIAGGVIGTLAGIGILAMVIAFFLRRFRRSRRVRPESDFGNFRRSAFVTDRSMMSDEPEMVQSHHKSTASVGSTATAGLAGYGAFKAATVQEQRTQPAPATTSAASVPLQERPKYVYGQDPVQQDDEESEMAHGAYSSEPHMQTSYDPEAYGNYAKYDNEGVAQGGYQDAQREYQGQAGGYDAQQQHQEYAAYAQYANYDQNGQQQYAGYEQQQVGEAQNGYVAPHPYSTAGAHRSTNSDAYGGM